MDEDYFDDELEVEREYEQKDAWHVIDAYFDEKGLVRQQLDSFDHFLNNILTQTIENQDPITLTPRASDVVGVAQNQVWSDCWLGLLSSVLP